MPPEHRNARAFALVRVGGAEGIRTPDHLPENPIPPNSPLTSNYSNRTSNGFHYNRNNRLRFAPTIRPTMII